MDSATTTQRGIEIIDRSRERLRFLTVARGIRPCLDDVAARDIEAALEGTRESVFFEDVASLGRRDRSEWFESQPVAVPRASRFVPTPRQLLSAITVVPRPEGSVPLVETDDALDTLERTPGGPRRALGELVAKRRSIEGVGRSGVGVQGSCIKNIAVTLRSCAHKDVVVQVRFTVTVETVRKAHHALPPRRFVAFETTASIANDERTLFEVLHGRAHRGSMSVHHTTRMIWVDGEKHRHGTRRRDHEVIADDRGAFTRHEHARDLGGTMGVAVTPKPPAWTFVAQSIELVGGVIREVGDVVRTTRK